MLYGTAAAVAGSAIGAACSAWRVAGAATEGLSGARPSLVATATTMIPAAAAAAIVFHGIVRGGGIGRGGGRGLSSETVRSPATAASAFPNSPAVAYRLVGLG